MNQHKGFAPILIVILIALAVGGYLIYQNQNQPKTTPSTTAQLTLAPVYIPELSSTDQIAKFQKKWDKYIESAKTAGQKLSQLLDQELPQANYTSIEGTDLEIKIPPSYSMPQGYGRIMTFVYDEFSNDDHNLYWKIEDCDDQMTNGNQKYTESLCKNLLSHFSQAQIDSYRKEQRYFLLTNHNFSITKIQTSLTPQEWVLDNVIYEGTKLRDWPGRSRGVEHTINGFSFLAIQVACCSAYSMEYLTPYQDAQGNKILLKFGTSDRLGSIQRSEGIKTIYESNFVLDKILATLKKK